MKKDYKQTKQSTALREKKVNGIILCPHIGGCGNGWTCDRCPNVGCPANERN